MIIAHFVGGTDGRDLCARAAKKCTRRRPHSSKQFNRQFLQVKSLKATLASRERTLCCVYENCCTRLLCLVATAGDWGFAKLFNGSILA